MLYFLAQQLRQALGNSFGRQALELQHDDLLASQPGFVQDSQRQQGAFTGSGRGIDDKRVLCRMVLPDSRYDFPNG